MKRALIVGVTGQDGTLLANLLGAKGIDYVGLNREGVVDSQGLCHRPGQLTDPEFIRSLVDSQPPSHVYYLAAHHHSSQDVNISQDINLWKLSLEVQVLGLVNVLESLRLYSKAARLFYAASSHVFGSPQQTPQDESIPMLPDGVYGSTKLMGIEACSYYRRHYGMFASVGILYNHESEYRKAKFLSQKIIQGAIKIKKGQATRLVLGDLSAELDWGYAPDYVEAMVRILALENPDQYIIATGQPHSVREFVGLVFQQLNLDYKDWVEEDSSIIRKSKCRLIGNPGKLHRDTGWSPSVSFPEMVRLLTEQTQLRLSQSSE